MNLAQLMPGNYEIHLAGIAGSTRDALAMLDILGKNKIKTWLCLGGRAMYKTRYVKDGKYLFRHDNFQKFRDEDIDFFKGTVRCATMLQEKFDAIIFSDYDKGTLCEEVVNCCKNSELIVVDSKKEDLRMFQGAVVLKLNAEEYSKQVSQKNYDNVEDFFESVIVTLGENGAQLRCGSKNFHKQKHSKWIPGFSKTTTNVYSSHVINFPTQKVEKVDVTGCRRQLYCCNYCCIIR